MRRPVLIGVAALTLLASGVGAWVLWPRATTEVSEQDALGTFRDRTATTATPPEDAEGSTPEPGVYRFAASGQEEVKFGPLPAETRPIPETVTAVVLGVGDACFDLTVSLFAEHTEDTRYCTDNDTLSLAAHTKHQQIGALSPTATMACDPATLLTRDEAEHDLACTLELSGGPATVTAALTGTAVRTEPEERTVGDESATATPVTISYDVSGDLSGTWTETMWLTDTNLPVRMERSLDLSGPASISEHSEFDLVDLTPTT